MDWRRRGQAGAAVLIVLIALLILLYVLFLPPAERAVLLGEGSGSQPGGPTGDRGNVIFSTVPVTTTDSGVEVRSLSSFTVRTITSGNALAERNKIEVSRSIFHNNDDTIFFDANSDTKNVVLSFSALEHSGSLFIDLNGERIFSQDIVRRQVSPIVIPANKLLNYNELKFSASPVGFQIWKSNKYALSNVLVTGDVTTFDDAYQKQLFVVPELSDVRRVQLRFKPECFDEVGKLTINLNDDPIFVGKPECGVDTFMDLAFSRLNEGENELVWRVDDGRYIIDDIDLIYESEVTGKTESFTLSQELLTRVIGKNGDINLRLSFRDVGAEGVIRVNGNPLAFRTHKQSFAAPITPYVKAGSNTVELDETSSEVTLLEVLYD